MSSDAESNGAGPVDGVVEVAKVDISIEVTADTLCRSGSLACGAAGVLPAPDTQERLGVLPVSP